MSSKLDGCTCGPECDVCSSARSYDDYTASLLLRMVLVCSPLSVLLFIYLHYAS